VKVKVNEAVKQHSNAGDERSNVVRNGEMTLRCLQPLSCRSKQ
jgi:hypothetical protein